jgi:hypothetical protein
MVALTAASLRECSGYEDRGPLCLGYQQSSEVPSIGPIYRLEHFQYSPAIIWNLDSNQGDFHSDCRPLLPRELLPSRPGFTA